MHTMHTIYESSTSDSEHIRRVRQDTNKMAVDGPRPAESLRHLACSLAALNPAPWEKVRQYAIVITVKIAILSKGQIVCNGLP